jgi:hypothetical protein
MQAQPVGVTGPFAVSIRQHFFIHRLKIPMKPGRYPIKGPQGVQHVVSDKNGKYEWKGLPSGKYQIRATLPHYTSVLSRDVEFDLPG